MQFCSPAEEFRSAEVNLFYCQSLFCTGCFLIGLILKVLKSFAIQIKQYCSILLNIFIIEDIVERICTVCTGTVSQNNELKNFSTKSPQLYNYQIG
jgi:hypothetical protein